MPLLESEAPKNPFVLFNRWFRDASEAGALQSDAVTLATATNSGAPSARMVLFKGVEEGSFVFYSNYGSRKGRELAQNNRAALVFFWSIKRHQVRVSGTVRRLTREASAEYFQAVRRLCTNPRNVPRTPVHNSPIDFATASILRCISPKNRIRCARPSSSLCAVVAMPSRLPSQPHSVGETSNCCRHRRKLGQS